MTGPRKAIQFRRRQIRGGWGAEQKTQSLGRSSKDGESFLRAPPSQTKPRAGHVPHARSERGNQRTLFWNSQEGMIKDWGGIALRVSIAGTRGFLLRWRENNFERRTWQWRP
jgi:hypothetical protein